jgi:hypothetical protein
MKSTTVLSFFGGSTAYRSFHVSKYLKTNKFFLNNKHKCAMQILGGGVYLFKRFGATSTCASAHCIAMVWSLQMHK